MTARVAVLATVKEAYRLIWAERWLHLKAIWPPIVFLVTAEVCYHKIFHGGDTGAKIWDTLNNAPWYWLAGLALTWLTGLKFLLSFSISWRRHLLLGEKFDPFFFKKPFWKYLGFLLLTYAWLMISLLYFILPGAGIWIILGSDTNYHGLMQVVGIIYAGIFYILPLLLFTTILVRQVPYFTSLAIEEKSSWKECCKAMRSNVLRYIAIWILAMAPIFAFTFAVGQIIHRLGFDISTVPVALFESILRQAALFIHFSIGASIGAIVYRTLIMNPAPETK